jgi:hypothetical protein
MIQDFLKFLQGGSICGHFWLTLHGQNRITLLYRSQHGISQADVIAVVVHCVNIYGEIEEEKLNEWFEIAKLS